MKNAVEYGLRVNELPEHIHPNHGFWGPFSLFLSFVLILFLSLEVQPSKEAPEMHTMMIYTSGIRDTDRGRLSNLRDSCSLN